MPATTVTPLRAAVLHWLEYAGIPYNRSRVKKRIRGRKAQRTERYRPDAETFAQYMIAVAESDVPEPCWTILQLLPWTGLRINEACTLRPNAITKVGDVPALHVVGKGNKTRNVPLGSVARKLLSRWRRDRKEDLDGDRSPWLFPSPQNPDRHVAPDTVRYHLRRLRRDYDLPEQLTPHKFRHFYAGTLVDPGAALIALKELLGHASVTTTEIYAQPSFATLAETAALLEED